MEGHMDSIQGYLDALEFDHKSMYFTEKDLVISSDSITDFGMYTDIISPLEAVRSFNPVVILLISDGNHNHQGTSPSQLTEYPLSVHTFGIGKEESSDVRLVETLYPDYVYMGDSIDISVVVQSHGYKKGNATVKLVFDRSKKTLQNSFQLSDTKAKHTIGFRTVITQGADTSFTVSILPSPGESYKMNNRQRYSLTLIDRKIQVLYYTDHMSLNTKFIMRALEQNPRLDITPIIRTQSGQYIDPYDRQSRTLPLLDTINVLIVDNISGATLPWSQIEDAVRSGLGLLCVGTVQQITPQWQSMLPIMISEAVMEITVPIMITEGFSCLSPGKKYPPFFFIHRVLGTKENAVTLASVNSIPVIAYQRFGQGTVFQINCLNIGTWHFMQTGMFQQDILSCLLPDIIRFVAPVGRNKRLVLSSSHRTFMVGERVDLTLKSYDHDFRQAGGGDFSAKFADRTIPFFEVHQGIYHSSFIADRAGDITLNASGILDNEPLTSNPISLQVREGSLENIQTLNQTFLETIAHRTGGVSYPIDSLVSFTIPNVASQYHVIHLDLNNPIGYLFVLILLAVDWIVRRRKGIV